MKRFSFALLIDISGGLGDFPQVAKRNKYGRCFCASVLRAALHVSRRPCSAARSAALIYY